MLSAEMLHYKDQYDKARKAGVPIGQIDEMLTLIEF